MSGRHVTWVMGLRSVKGTARHVLLQLAYWSSANGHVTRSHQQLADDTGYSVRTIQDALKDLTGCGVIDRKRRTTRRGRLADTFVILAVLPAKSAARRKHTLSAKSAERTGKNCRAYTKEDSNHHHLAANDDADTSRSASTEGARGKQANCPPDNDCEEDGVHDLALRLAGLAGAPPLGTCEEKISFLVEEHGLSTLSTAMHRLRQLVGVKTPTRMLQLICDDIEREHRQRGVTQCAHEAW